MSKYKKSFAILPKVIEGKFIWLEDYLVDELGNPTLATGRIKKKILEKKALYEKATARKSK